MIVHSPKTEHCGKSSRVVPLFPQLRRYLQEAWERAPKGHVKPLPKIRPETNLRTMTKRLLTRVGIVDEIPRFYQNCRSSRQTELQEEFPTHVVCAWLGNTEVVARRHYLKVQEGHFERATTAGLHYGLQQSAESGGKESQPEEAAHEKTLRKSVSPAYAASSKYTREDSNL